MASRELSVACVGAAYPNKDGGNRRSEIAFCDPGEEVILKREPKNEFDEHAIAVFSKRDFQIGYVASQRAVFLSGLMRDGHVLYAIFQDIAPWGAVIRIGVDGPVETLPPPQDYRSSTGQTDELDQTLEQDFWPDEMPPDDRVRFLQNYC